MSEQLDVVIIGAGMAGLSAAKALREGGRRIVVLEARERIGGRVLTLHDTGLPVAVELGAEFVHGTATEIEELARADGAPTYDIGGRRFASRSGRLRTQDDYWTQLDRVMGRLDPARDRDRSFQEFLDSRPGGRQLAGARRLAAQFVEGFHAADLTRISAGVLAHGGSPGGDPRESRIGRVSGGYDRLAHCLAAPISDGIQLGACVERVEWGRSGVSVATRPTGGGATSTYEAHAAVITVSVGVLQAEAGAPGAIVFDPPLESRREALSHMTMGGVVRVVLRLRERFWAASAMSRRRGLEDLDRATFVLGDDESFPAWWTTYPIRVPMMVAWAGGPHADRLAGRTTAELVDAATVSLGRTFGLSSKRARALVDAGWTHDWQSDPFSRGAYSYTLAGGEGAARKLAQPMSGTLYLAGEATEPEARSGTVHGAIGSGRRAAKAVLASLARRTARP